MNYLICIGHPAQFHLFKNIIAELHSHGHKTEVLISSKDILEYLCEQGNFKYNNVLSRRKTGTKLSLTINFLKRYGIIYKSIRNFKPDILLGSEVTLPILGKTFRIPSIVFSEDDAIDIPQFARLAYPFAKTILSPNVCYAGKWEWKKIGYEGYHELAYLHPNHFKPEKDKIKHLLKDKERYFILRFSSFNAYHDHRLKEVGFNNSLIEKIISILEPYGNIYITSEREVTLYLEKFIIPIDLNDMHHALYYSDMYIGDSQSMAVEAAVLGVPSIRFNKFVSKYQVSVLEELENKYKLTIGINSNAPNKLIKTVRELLDIKDLKIEWHMRQKRMLSEKIDVASFITWIVENYPESSNILKRNPDYQDKFK